MLSLRCKAGNFACQALATQRCISFHVVAPGVVAVTPRRLPDRAACPPYARGEPVPPSPLWPTIKTTTADLQCMRASCQLARRALTYAGSLVRPGVTTEEIDQRVHDFIVDAGAYPSPLNYRGFPKSVCTSVNNVACHGIPDNRALADGDMINIDITVYLNSFHGDNSETFPVGKVDARGLSLMKVVRECRDLAISTCGPGVRLALLGTLIEQHAKKSGFAVCMEFLGHGIGRHFHELPDILHFTNTGRGTMKAGMVFMIEPVINEGGAGMRVLSDGWTAVTVDGLRSVQYEHILLITDSGHEVLTL